MLPTTNTNSTNSFPDPASSCLVASAAPTPPSPPSLPAAPECPVCFVEFPTTRPSSTASCDTKDASGSEEDVPDKLGLVSLTCRHEVCGACLSSIAQTSFPYHFARCPLCRQDSSLSCAKMSETRRPFRQTGPPRTTPYGNVYVQFGTPGLASYHFDSPDRCYVSYANAPHSWKLSDGSPAPIEKLFVDTSYDPETRTFKGKIVWAPLTFGGDAMWSYELVFDPSFTRVESGNLQTFKDAAAEEPSDVQPFVTEYWGDAGLSYLRWNPAPVASPFGSVFCQGQEFVPAVGVASYHFDSPTDAYVSYARSLPSWKLSDGSSPPKKAMFQDATYDPLTRTFTGRVSFAPATFGGSQVRVYRLVFGEDFNAIVDGEVSKYGTEAEYEAGVAPSQGSISFHPVHGPLKYHRLRLDCL